MAFSNIFRSYGNYSDYSVPEGASGAIAFLASRGVGIDAQNLNPTFANRLAAAVAAGEKATGQRADFSSLYRSSAQQAQIKANSLGRPVAYGGKTYQPQATSRGFPAAYPGRSFHERGEAADFKANPVRDWVEAHAKDYGLASALGTQKYGYDAPHVQLDTKVASTNYDGGAPLAYAGNAGAKSLAPAQVAAAREASGAPPSSFYRPGVRDRAVGNLQRTLQSGGFNPGRIDARYGPKTDAALGRSVQGALDVQRMAPPLRDVTASPVSPLAYGMGQMPFVPPSAPQAASLPPAGAPAAAAPPPAAAAVPPRPAASPVPFNAVPSNRLPSSDPGMGQSGRYALNWGQNAPPVLAGTAVAGGSVPGATASGTIPLSPAAGAPPATSDFSNVVRRMDAALGSPEQGAGMPWQGSAPGGPPPVTSMTAPPLSRFAEENLPSSADHPPADLAARMPGAASQAAMAGSVPPAGSAPPRPLNVGAFNDRFSGPTGINSLSPSNIGPNAADAWNRISQIPSQIGQGLGNIVNGIGSMFTPGPSPAVAKPSGPQSSLDRPDGVPFEPVSGDQSAFDVAFGSPSPSPLRIMPGSPGYATLPKSLQSPSAGAAPPRPPPRPMPPPTMLQRTLGTLGPFGRAASMFAGGPDRVGIPYSQSQFANLPTRPTPSWAMSRFTPQGWHAPDGMVSNGNGGFSMSPNGGSLYSWYRDPNSGQLSWMNSANNVMDSSNSGYGSGY